MSAVRGRWGDEQQLHQRHVPERSVPLAQGHGKKEKEEASEEDDDNVKEEKEYPGKYLDLDDVLIVIAHGLVQPGCKLQHLDLSNLGHSTRNDKPFGYKGIKALCLALSINKSLRSIKMFETQYEYVCCPGGWYDDEEDPYDRTVDVSRGLLLKAIRHNKKSKLNEEIVDMVWEGQFHSISVLAVDNVALNGNAILSVLRTSCDQTSETKCGSAIAKPRLDYFHLSTIAYVGLSILYLVVFLWIGTAAWLSLRERQTSLHPKLLWTAWHRLRDGACSTCQVEAQAKENDKQEQLI